MREARKAWIGEVVAITFVLVAILLSRHIVANPEMAEAMARGLATPLTWPKIMLGGVLFFAGGWSLQLAFRLFRLRKQHLMTVQSAEREALEPDDVGGDHHAIPLPPLRVIFGIVLALTYAFSIPTVGFPLATEIFLVLWFLIGGVRSPLKLALVSGIGVVVILYVFVKLALMPLDHGVGALGDFTVALFRLLGIY